MLQKVFYTDIMWHSFLHQVCWTASVSLPCHRQQEDTPARTEEPFGGVLDLGPVGSSHHKQNEDLLWRSIHNRYTYLEVLELIPEIYHDMLIAKVFTLHPFKSALFIQYRKFVKCCGIRLSAFFYENYPSPHYEAVAYSELRDEFDMSLFSAIITSINQWQQMVVLLC